MKNKAFTLVELLAVLIVLGIIALIAVPIVLNLIKDAKTNAGINSARAYMNAVEEAVMEYSLNTRFPDTICNILDGGNLDCEALDSELVINIKNKEQIEGGGLIEIKNRKVVRLKELWINNQAYKLQNKDNDKGKEIVAYNLTPASCFDYRTEEILDYEFNSENCIPAVLDLFVSFGTFESADSEGAYDMAAQVCNDENQDWDAILNVPEYFNIFYKNNAVTVNESKKLDATIITNYKCNYKDVIIPTRLGGMNVGEIGNGAFQSKSLDSVELPEYLTKIDEFAFSTNNITNIELPSSIKRIDSNAFSHNKIKNISIPKNVEYLSGFAYNQIENIIIPNNVTVIGKNAFRGNKISSITIPENVIEIEEYAFSYNKIDGELIIPSSVTAIGDSAFAYNNISGTLVIPDTVLTIGSSAFEGYSYNNGTYGPNRINSVVIGNGIKDIENRTFAGNPISDLSISNTVETIGSQAFIGNNLTRVTIPNSVVSIGDDAFMGKYLNSSEIKSITLGNHLETIGANAFYGHQCNTIDIPDSVISIGRQAFISNIMENVSIGSGIKSMGENAFCHIYYGYPKLKTVLIYVYKSEKDNITYDPTTFCGFSDDNITWLDDMIVH